MSNKYDPNYDGSDEWTPQKEAANQWYINQHETDDDDEEEVVSYQEQDRRRQYGYAYEHPWLNDEDFL